MQHQLNTRIDPAWYTKNQDFALAIMVEAGEFADHTAWKWWSKQEVNVKQAQMELIDILHFGLAITARGMLRGLPELVTATEAEWKSHLMLVGWAMNHEGLEVHFHSEMADLSAIEQAIGCVKLVVAHAIEEESFALAHAVKALELMGVTDVYKTFVGKNVLNMFRQKHGYKAGTYVKEWFGEEDNVALTRVVELWNEEDGLSWIFDVLEELYTLVEQSVRVCTGDTADKLRKQFYRMLSL
jgi:dimeric dUTPase (all-alpha-NTP-PPase superfamily)